MMSGARHGVVCLVLLPLSAWALTQHAAPGAGAGHPGPLAETRMPAVRSAPPNPVARGAEVGAERTLGQWLMRMHEASRRQAYVGTYVVSSVGGSISSSRIWHACDGEQQVERVDALTGNPRSTFRHNDQVVTFFPDSRLVQSERREALRAFPDVVRTPDAGLSEFYSVRRLGVDRVAGLEADVVQIDPKDRMRFGYRIWSELNTGLVLKSQTLDGNGRALEQSAFSEVQLENRINIDQLLSMMRDTQGFRSVNVELTPTTAAAEGWNLKSRVLGFNLQSCVRRPIGAPVADAGNTKGQAGRTVQWIFSDGLASVSLFVEPADPQQRAQEVSMTMGATGLFARRIQEWWLTVVGEVPTSTLQVFSQSIERVR